MATVLQSITLRIIYQSKYLKGDNKEKVIINFMKNITAKYCVPSTNDTANRFHFAFSLRQKYFVMKAYSKSLH